MIQWCFIPQTLVLSKITPRQFRKMPTPYKDVSLPMVDPDPLCSNVYSLGERILLVWLNLHYEQHRQNIWENSTRGEGQDLLMTKNI